MSQHLALMKEQFSDAFDRVLASGILVNGSEISVFEQQWATFSHGSFAVGVASGYDALLLACNAADIGAGARVGIPAHTCPATALAIAASGASIIPLEVDQQTALLDLDWLESSGLIKQLDAIVPVNLYGIAPDYKRLKSLVGNQVWIIEDNAQGHGIQAALFQIGNSHEQLISATSFYPTKNLGALGEAGAVTTNSAQIAEKLKALRNYGTGPDRFVSVYSSGNHRLDELQAAFLSCSFGDLGQTNKIRRNNYLKIAEALNNHPLLKTLPAEEIAAGNGHLAVVRTPKRDQLAHYLQEVGIQTMVHYPVPIHLQPALKDVIVEQSIKLPQAESWAQEVLTVPNHQYMTDDDLEHLVNTLKSFSIR